MRSAIIAISLLVAGTAAAQSRNTEYHEQMDSLRRVKKGYDQTKKNCIHMDTVLTAMKKTQQDQLTIIDKLKAIKERQTTVQTTNEPR